MLNDHIVLRLINKYIEHIDSLPKERTDISIFKRNFKSLKDKEKIDIFNELFKFQGIRILEDMDNFKEIIHLPGLGRIVLNKNIRDRLEYFNKLGYIPSKEEIYNINKRIYWNNLKDKLERKQIRDSKPDGTSKFSREELTDKR